MQSVASALAARDHGGKVLLGLVEAAGVDQRRSEQHRGDGPCLVVADLAGAGLSGAEVADGLVESTLPEAGPPERHRPPGAEAEIPGALDERRGPGRQLPGDGPALPPVVDGGLLEQQIGHRAVGPLPFRVGKGGVQILEGIRQPLAAAAHLGPSGQDGPPARIPIGEVDQGCRVVLVGDLVVVPRSGLLGEDEVVGEGFLVGSAARGVTGDDRAGRPGSNA
jgi:hypothetical protein